MIFYSLECFQKSQPWPEWRYICVFGLHISKFSSEYENLAENFKFFIYINSFNFVHFSCFYGFFLVALAPAPPALVVSAPSPTDGWICQWAHLLALIRSRQQRTCTHAHTLVRIAKALQLSLVLKSHLNRRRAQSLMHPRDKIAFTSPFHLVWPGGSHYSNVVMTPCIFQSLHFDHYSNRVMYANPMSIMMRSMALFRVQHTRNGNRHNTPRLIQPTKTGSSLMKTIL